MVSPALSSNQIAYKGVLSVVLNTSIWLPTAEYPDLTGGRLRVDIVDSEGITGHLFLTEVFEMYNSTTNSRANVRRQVGVAAITDLFTYYADVIINDPHVPNYCRTSWLDMQFGSPDDLRIGIDSIKRDVASLLRDVYHTGQTGKLGQGE